ncbi:MAG: hypothetical protein AAF840_04695 [Bacteroidota bacterium]
MRILLTLLLVTLACTCVRAQVGTRVDAEYASWCMVDSIGVGQVNRFTRLVNITTLEVKDIDPVAGTVYTIQGTLYTCEAYDLQQSTRDPLADLYEDCQCEYESTQEAHRVRQINGGATQTYEVEFQEVVYRRCAGQANRVVVFRDTLIKTQALNNPKIQRFWNFTAPGQYIDKVNVRLYTGSSTATTITLDFNPSTVQASYPALTLDPADFTYDGSNYQAMNEAFRLVMDEAIGATTNAYNTLEFGYFNLSIFTEIRHDPDFPYVTLPVQGDADYLVTSTIPGNSTNFGFPALGTTTTTSTYTEQCSGVYVEEYAVYLDYNTDFPLAFQPRLNVVTTPRPGDSNPTEFCDVEPAICAELVTDPVTVEGCIETCSDVLNIAGHLPVMGIDTTLGGQEYNSLSIYVTQGPVGVTLSGIRINYPAGWHTLWSGEPGKLLQNTVGIDATNAEAIISFVR